MIKHKIIKLTFLLSIFTASVSYAESEIEEWYLSKSGDYLVRDSVNGTLHAQLANSKSGNPEVYIFMFDSDCEGKESTITSHNPLYVNGTLVRYLQYCEGERRYFFPATTEGRKYLFSEFKNKSFVDISTHNKSFTAIFSAKGFSKSLKEIQVNSKAI